jgi:hypothetical protein
MNSEKIISCYLAAKTFQHPRLHNKDYIDGMSLTYILRRLGLKNGDMLEIAKKTKITIHI